MPNKEGLTTVQLSKPKNVDKNDFERKGKCEIGRRKSCENRNKTVYIDQILDKVSFDVSEEKYLNFWIKEQELQYYIKKILELCAELISQYDNYVVYQKFCKVARQIEA